MAPKRELSPPLSGDDRSGGDYSNARQAQLVRSAPPPAVPPPEEYDPNSFGVSLAPEDFVRDEDLDHIMAVVKLRSEQEAAERTAQLARDQEIHQIFLHQGLKQDRVAMEKKAAWEEDVAMIIDLDSDDE